MSTFEYAVSVFSIEEARFIANKMKLKADQWKYCEDRSRDFAGYRLPSHRLLFINRAKIWDRDIQDRLTSPHDFVERVARIDDVNIITIFRKNGHGPIGINTLKNNKNMTIGMKIKNATPTNPKKYKNRETGELVDVYFAGAYMVNFVNRPAKNGYIEQDMLDEDIFENRYEENK